MRLLTMSMFGEPYGVRDLILMFLAERSSMTFRKLHRAIRRSGACVSYQAVYKQLQRLIEEGEVIRCNHVEYSINPEWIEALRGFCDIMERNVNGFDVD